MLVDIEKLSVDKYPTNKEVEPLLTSIRMLDLLSPITINQDNQVIDGVRRLHAATILGFEDIECVVKKCTNIGFLYYRIAMNSHRSMPLELEKIISLVPNIKLSELSYQAGLDPDYIIKGLRLTKIKKHLRDVPLSIASHLVHLESYAQGASQDYISRARKDNPEEVAVAIVLRIKEIKAARRLVRKGDTI